MLSLKTKSFYLPVLVTVDGGERAEPSALKIALVIDMASNIIKDPLNHTGVREQGEPILEDRA